MNYAPNTHQWERGDLVLHDADAKAAKMLMRVKGYTKNGLCKVEYIEPDRTREVYKNDIKYLHDPRQWLEYANGYPVLLSAPNVCPVCNSAEIETDRMPEEDEFDDVLSKECGFEVTDDNYFELWDSHPEFLYNYAEMVCENEECGAVIAYGQRGYYNSKTNFYDGKKPSPLDYPKSEQSTTARAEAERIAQEAAGQQRLFKDEQS